MKCMAQSSANDELLINLLVNKAKLAQPSNYSSNQIVLSVEKHNDHNQILTIEQRLEKLEKDVEIIHTMLQYNQYIAKVKKE